MTYMFGEKTAAINMLFSYLSMTTLSMIDANLEDAELSEFITEIQTLLPPPIANDDITPVLMDAMSSIAPAADQLVIRRAVKLIADSQKGDHNLIFP